MPELAALVLAAGAGRRFGGIKQLLSVDGEPLICRAITLAQTVAPGAVQVVLGAHRVQVAPRLPRGLPVVECADWAEGLGTSLAAGIAGLRGQPDGVLLLLADQIALRADALQTLAARWRAVPGSVFCAFYDGQPGVPAIFPRRLFGELMALRGERGAKPLLRRECGPERQQAMPEAAIDIDTAADLTRWQASR
ncbi:MAG: nucleotidyltransferase family protein [Xanthomonadaceae bacterium]|nr:nucleotidyltransferase family protein [Xanthomonadaceae bacterium]MDE3071121.1 nucleotidyltransferase family protein [Pseudomonadota bacterium]